MKELEPHDKSINVKEYNSIHIDQSIRDLTKSTKDSYSRSDQKVVVVDTAPYRTSSNIHLSKPFFYSLIGIVTVLLLILAFFLGRNSLPPKANSQPVIIKTSPPPQIVSVQAPPVAKRESTQLPPKQVVVMTLPPPAPKTTEPKDIITPSPQKQTSNETDEEVRFIPQNIAPGWQAEDPSITDTQEKLKKYASQIDQLLIQTSGWQSIKLILTDMQQGTVRGDKNRTLAIAAWLNRVGAQIGMLEVPQKAREHHMAAIHFTAQGEAFLTEITAITPQEQHYRITQLQNKIQSLIDQMTDIEEMTLTLKKEI